MLNTLFLSWFCPLCEKARAQSNCMSIVNVTIKTDVLRAFSVNLLWLNSQFHYSFSKMSNKNCQVSLFESLYDVGDEDFSLSKSLEVGPIALVDSSSSFFYRRIAYRRIERTSLIYRRLYRDNNCLI